MKISKISLALKALRELGPRKLGLFAWYQAGLKSGIYRRMTGDRRRKTDEPRLPSLVLRPVLDLPDPAELLAVIGQDGLSRLTQEADEIVAGRVRLFGGQPVPLDLTPPGDLAHWTQVNFQTFDDIKFTWEPARFGWVFALGQAYHLTGDERYPAAFWRYFEIFMAANPTNRGPNWVSAQEVALRIMAFSFAGQVFASSGTSPTRNAQLAISIADHAARIPPTLIYARAQNNNHLLSEAAGLITASLALPDHPQAKRWSELGWRWFNHGLKTQIAEDGAYTQHSANYHRLALQLGLWVAQMQHVEGITPNSLTPNPISPDLLTLNLQLATQWLLAITDPASGRVPNLGPNDGAYILPLTSLPFSDYRPVLQAASQAFLGEPAFDPGKWDEMGIWLQVEGYRLRVNDSNISASQRSDRQLSTVNRQLSASPPTLHAPHSWAYLRAAHFTDRPGHADQLHLDLWWRGLNVAQDAGTYRYNADPPWDNALTHTAVHNTVMVDGREQMSRAGRFLYLDRAQAQITAREAAEDGSWERLVASHNGYCRSGVLHQRSVTAYRSGRWVVEDRLLPAPGASLTVTHTARLHWLLPDWEYRMQNAECGMRVNSPHGWFSLDVRVPSGNDLQPSTFHFQLVRAGELLYGDGEHSPTWGWVSPTYGVKVPALSFSVTVREQLPIRLVSEWIFPEEA